VARSTGREHLELVRNSGPEPTAIVGDVQAASAAAVPLRSHGAVIGTLVIADPREGVFVPEDIRLLSTLATHAASSSPTRASSRWCGAPRSSGRRRSTALSEGIAVVDDEGPGAPGEPGARRPAARDLPNVVGVHLGAALLGKSHALLEVAGRRPPRATGPPRWSRAPSSCGERFASTPRSSRARRLSRAWWC